MNLSSGRLTGLFVRTTTALRTSPRRTFIALLVQANQNQHDNKINVVSSQPDTCA